MQLDLTDRVAAEIRAELARQNISHRQLGEALGIHQTQATRRLRGEIAFNTAELETVAEFLGVPVSNFLGDKVPVGTPPPSPPPAPQPGPQPPGPGRPKGAAA
jgi:transcriptional regulator with XRE-family HTH domain